MPRIPLYNQGRGPTVQLATGPLSRRADRSAFTAPGRAFASLGESVSNIAFQFGQAEKNAETERVYAEQISKKGREFDEFKQKQPARTVEGFDILASNFRKDSMAEIDSLNLTQSQKQTIKNNLGRNIDGKIASARADVFNNYQNDRMKAFQRGIDTLVQDAGDKNLRESSLKDAEYLINFARENGFDTGYTMQGVRSAIRYNDALAASANPNLTLDQLRETKTNILTGAGEYAETDGAERQKLARVYQQRINEVEFGVMATLKAEEQDLMAKVAATGDDSGARNLQQKYRDMGREDFALQLGSDVYVAKASFEFIEDVGLASVQKAEQTFAEILDLPMDGDMAAENARVKKQATEFMANRRQLLDEDPARYVGEQLARQNKEVTPQSILATQRSMGVALRPFTNQQITSIQEDLAETTSELERQEMLRQFVYEFGGKDNPVSPELMLSLMPSAGFSMAEQLVASDPYRVVNRALLASQKVDDAALKQQIIAKNGSAEQINALVFEELSAYTGALISGGEQDVLSATASSEAASHLLELQEATSKLARYLFAFNDMSDKDAAKRAASLVNDKFVYPQVNDKTFILPVKYSQSQQIFEVELGKMLLDDELLANVDIPPYPGDVTGELSRQEYIGLIRAGGRWATNSGRTGVTLLDDTDNVVVDKTTGKGISISFAELQTQISQKAQSVEARQQLAGDTASQIQALNREITKMGGIAISRARQEGREAEHMRKMGELQLRRDILSQQLAELKDTRTR